MSTSADLNAVYYEMPKRCTHKLEGNCLTKGSISPHQTKDSVCKLQGFMLACSHLGIPMLNLMSPRHTFY